MKILAFETIDSTNTWALRNIDNVEDKTLVTAFSQTCGHGRFRRKWVSDNPENLYLTFVLKPSDYAHAANLTQYLSVIMVRVLKSYNVCANIKWSNDVRIQGKKIAGILCESTVRGGKIKGLALGIGVNLNMSETEVKKIDIPATALNLHTGITTAKDEFLKRLYDEFFEDYDEFLEKGFSYIKEEYRANLEYLGENVQVSNGAEKEEVLMLDITDEGELIVKDKNGTQKILRTADINFNPV